MLSLLLVVVAVVGSDAAGCGIFTNHFRVRDGVFSDICGDVSVSIDQGSPVSSADTLTIDGGSIVSLFPYVLLTGDQWAMVFEGQCHAASNILLSSTWRDDLIEFENDENAVCIESANISHCVSLPHSIAQPHSLILFQRDGLLTVYQNGEMVQTIDIVDSLELDFDRIGPANLAIQSLMFARDVPIEVIETFINTCEQFEDYNGSPTLSVDSGTSLVSESESTIAEDVSCAPSMTLMFFAGMWCMALLNLFCFGVHRYLKKREKAGATKTARHVSVSVRDHDTDDETEQLGKLDEVDEDYEDAVEETQMADDVDDSGLRKHSEQMGLKSRMESQFSVKHTVPTITTSHATDESL